MVQSRDLLCTVYGTVYVVGRLDNFIPSAYSLVHATDLVNIQIVHVDIPVFYNVVYCAQTGPWSMTSCCNDSCALSGHVVMTIVYRLVHFIM